MPTKYQKGRNFEYRTKKYLEKLGYWVVRTPASKTPADLIALKEGEKPLLVQCKSGTTADKKERAKLVKLANSIDAIPKLCYNINHKLKFYEIIRGKIMEVDTNGKNNNNRSRKGDRKLQARRKVKSKNNARRLRKKVKNV